MDAAIPANYYPHPYLTQPILYVTELASYITETDLAKALESCTPFKPRIPKDGSGQDLSGTIEFRTLYNAEKALATLNGRLIPDTSAPFNLSPYPPTDPPTVLPLPSAIPRLVKNLPPYINDSQLYDMFRPYGPIASVNRHGAFGRDTGVVEYWNEEDAIKGEEALHTAQLGNVTIAVQPYQPRRASLREFSPNVNAPVFVPGGVPSYGFPASSPHMSAGAFESPAGSSRGGFESPPHMFSHGPGQQVQLAPQSGPGSTSSSGLIDPCNLFIKNLDFDITSNTLFNEFRRFGHIVSARVMRSPAGVSRGFGFVSFQTPDQAANAMRTMDGTQMGTKQVIVRLHEPKALRQEKLRERFARSAPAATDARSASPSDESGSTPQTRPMTSERQRRGSGSYYNAALAGTIVLQASELYSLSPVVRREVLTGELGRRIREQMSGRVPETEVDGIVESLLNLQLEEIVQGMMDPAKFERLVAVARGLEGPEIEEAVDMQELGEMAPRMEMHEALGQQLAALQMRDMEQDQQDQPPPELEMRDFGTEQPQGGIVPTPELTPPQGDLLAPVPLGLSASAPEHPSTPVDFDEDSKSLTPPTVPASEPLPSTANGSATPVSERAKLRARVATLEPGSPHIDEITDLLGSLSKKERALCLFNSEYLKGKVADAKEVVQLMAGGSDDDDAPGGVELSPEVGKMVLSPEVVKLPLQEPTEGITAPRTPDLSSRGGSAWASPSSLPATPATSLVQAHTLASLAALPAQDIVRLVETNATTGLPLPKADPAVVRGTDEWVDELTARPLHEQKQKVGEKLHKTIRTFGAKKAAKVTIFLLDKEDLRSLAHLMNSYPAVLREKVAQTVLPPE